MPEDGERRLSFSLPPIRLPPLFPDRFTVRLPVPGFRHGRELSSGWTLLVVFGFDVADALLALTVGSAGGFPAVGLVRALGGTAIGATVASWLGLLYAWEVAAVLVGAESLTVVPTLSILLLVSLYRKRTESRG
jgi:hypothetical protein